MGGGIQVERGVIKGIVGVESEVSIEDVMVPF